MDNNLQHLFRGKVVIVGVGNRLKGDDGLGPALVERLRDQVNVPCVNAENSLGNYIGKILAEKPDTVLLIDAAHLEKEPGSYAIMEPEDVVQTGMTTHDVSLKLYVDLLLSKYVGKIFVLGVQPQQLELGSDLSESVLETLRDLEPQIVAAVNSSELGNAPPTPPVETAEAFPQGNKPSAPQAPAD